MQDILVYQEWLQFPTQRLDFILSKTGVWIAKFLTLELNFHLEYSRPGFHMCYAYPLYFV